MTDIRNPARDHSATGTPEVSGRAALPAWRALQAHAVDMQDVTLRELFDSDPHRLRDFSVEGLGIYADFSKQRITRETVRLLAELAEQCGLWEQVVEMFAGDEINVSEHRAALHTALRAPRGGIIRVDGENVVPKVHQVLDRMAAFADTVRNGQWTGHTGKPIRAVVNIGIGGSDLGPRMAYQALHAFSDRTLRMQFVSNVDGADFVEAIRDLDPAETLFVVSSKSWHTRETLTNAHTARDWTLAAFGGDTAAIAQHFVAVSTNADGVRDFGIDPANMFPFWDWVGGRYSFDAAVGLSLMIAIGPDNFTAMLAGMHDVDEHFRTTPLERNIPVLMGLLSIWYNNFLGAQTHAVLPALQPRPRPAAGLPAATGDGKQRQARHPRRDAHRLPDRADHLGPAGHQRTARLLPAPPPGHEAGPVRRHRCRCAVERVGGPARPAAREPVRADRGPGLRPHRGRGAMGHLRGRTGRAPGLRRQPAHHHAAARRTDTPQPRDAHRALRAQGLHRGHDLGR